MKKDECRFNIILNPGDPMHKTAINALNSQGRHKSQFLVNAVVHYIMNEHTASQTVIPTSDEIRTICREILTEMMGEMSPQNIPLIHEEELSEDTSDQDFDLNQIESTLNNFRKK